VARVADGHGTPEDDVTAMAAVAYEFMSGEQAPFAVMSSDVSERALTSDDMVSFAQVAPRAPDELVATLDELVAGRAITLSAQALATRFRRIAMMPQLALCLSLRARQSRTVARLSRTAARSSASSPGVAKSASSPFLHHSEVARLARREGTADTDEDTSGSAPSGSGRYASHEGFERISTRPSKKSV
jgi:hypothetical protein